MQFTAATSTVLENCAIFDEHLRRKKNDHLNACYTKHEIVRLDADWNYM